MNWVIVFGGAFNPPTTAHFWLAEHMLNEFAVEKVLFMPAGNWYPKPGLLSSFHREAMLESVINGGPHRHFELSTVETSSVLPLSTYETLQRVQVQYPAHPVGFLMGSDNLKQISTWRSAEALLKQFHFFVIPRGQDVVSDIVHVDPLLRQHRDHIVTVPLGVRHEDSSSYVRKLLTEGKSIRFLVPNPVLFYIKHYGLYLPQKEGVL